jgi:hypothetical protein
MFQQIQGFHGTAPYKNIRNIMDNRLMTGMVDSPGAALGAVQPSWYQARAPPPRSVNDRRRQPAPSNDQSIHRYFFQPSIQVITPFGKTRSAIHNRLARTDAGNPGRRRPGHRSWLQQASEDNRIIRIAPGRRDRPPPRMPLAAQSGALAVFQHELRVENPDSGLARRAAVVMV